MTFSVSPTPANNHMVTETTVSTKGKTLLPAAAALGRRPTKAHTHTELVPTGLVLPTELMSIEFVPLEYQVC